MKLKDNTILITGGGSGIGRSLAEAFLALGNQVIIAGRREQALRDTAEAAPGMKYMIFDQDAADAIPRFAAEVTEKHPTLNVLINNAGIQLMEDIAQGDVSGAEATVNTNLLGPIRLTGALLPSLLEKPAATILNVSSTLAFLPAAMLPTYSATKAALHSYTQSLRFRLLGTSVQVIELIPPWVQTALQGERGMNPKAMPLAEYVAETMSLLEACPDATEIVVARARAARYAEPENYDALFTSFNEGFIAAQVKES